jgi:hypothetical protein
MESKEDVIMMLKVCPFIKPSTNLSASFMVLGDNKEIEDIEIFTDI